MEPRCKRRGRGVDTALLGSWIPSVHKAGTEEQWEAWVWRFDFMLCGNAAGVFRTGMRRCLRSRRSREAKTLFAVSEIVGGRCVSFHPVLAMGE